MQGRFADAERLAAATGDLAERTAVPHRAEALMGSLAGVLLWQGRAAELLPLLANGGLSIPVDSPTVLTLLRAGEIERARAELRRRPLPIDTEDFLLLFRLAVAAEAAFVLRLPALAADVYARALPYGGHVATAGSGVALGPVSAFLALAAAATGELVTAARHADEALDRCAAWGLGPVAAWLTAHRDAWRVLTLQPASRPTPERATTSFHHHLLVGRTRR